MDNASSNTSKGGLDNGFGLAGSTVEQADISSYAGDIVDTTATPLKEGQYSSLAIPDPATLLYMFDPHMHPKGKVLLYEWQVELLENFATIKPSMLKPHKFCLCAANGSGKDAFIVAPFVVWFALSKVQSRTIITSSSGTQLTSQTETYIRTLCENVNLYFGEEIFRIRQRYIKCRLSGSEIRLFATDEAGKAEGYHPITPGSEMAIVVNEGKSVADEIHQALRRCTGYNYWIEVSTPGEPLGFFHSAFTNWKHTKRVTSYDCPRHLSLEDIEEDKRELGEHSAFFRSKHLALFTSLGGEVIIPAELVEQLFSNPPKYSLVGNWDIRVGIDLAAGGDENVLCFVKGNKVIKEVWFRETDTTATADRLERELNEMKIPMKSLYIFADDGGVGHSIIDMLVRKGWDINRILNQSIAINKKQFGNKGAENWYRCKRFFEEGLLDIRSLSKQTLEQIGSRRYKQGLTGARILLEKKKEAKANGRPSPDRADALMLSLTGLVIDDFLKAMSEDSTNPLVKDGERVLKTPEDVMEYYRESIQYGEFNGINVKKTRIGARRVFNSLKNAMGL